MRKKNDRMNETFFLLYEILYVFYVFYYDANTHSIREFLNIYFLKNIRIKESIYTQDESQTNVSMHTCGSIFIE